MAKTFSNWTDFHHYQNQWYHLIIAVTLVPFSLLFLEIETGKESLLEYGGIYWVVVVITSCAVLLLNWVVWKKTQLVLDVEAGIQAKLKLYKANELKRYGWLCLAGLVAFAGLWLTNYFLLIILYFGVLVHFSIIRPTMDRFFREGQLKKDQREHVKKGSLEDPL